MTSGRGSPAATSCPIPPADLWRRALPFKVLDLDAHPLRRIHRTSYDPIHYNKPGQSGCRFRFDAPNDEYGTLYASPSFETCVAETIIRDQFLGRSLPLMLETSQLATRSVATLGRKNGTRLKLADLTQPVIHLGCTAQVLTDLNYLAPNLWSLALQQHPANVDGIYFRSRYANAESVAIFDRVPLVQTSPSLELLNASEMGNFLSRYNIGLI